MRSTNLALQRQQMVVKEDGVSGNHVALIEKIVMDLVGAAVTLEGIL